MKKDTKLFREEIIKLRKKKHKTIREVARYNDLSRTTMSIQKEIIARIKFSFQRKFCKFINIFVKQKQIKKINKIVVRVYTIIHEEIKKIRRKKFLENY